MSGQQHEREERQRHLPLTGPVPNCALPAPNRWLTLDTVLHELGHNVNVKHASRNGDQYGDNSCIM